MTTNTKTALPSTPTIDASTSRADLETQIAIATARAIANLEAQLDADAGLPAADRQVAMVFAGAVIRAETRANLERMWLRLQDNPGAGIH
jgi:hypothetical protein